MAHIAVYLQRTRAGLHPASAVALCWARDIASERGATVTAIALGDGGAWDHALAVAAGRFGADILLFAGPDGLRNLDARLNPVHVFVPWTSEGMRVAEDLPHRGAPVARWLTERHPAWHGGDAISGVIAGMFPWHALDQALEGEYEVDVDRVAIPDWVGPQAPPPFAFAIGSPWLAHAPEGGASELLRTALNRIGARIIDSEPPTGGGTLLAFGRPPAAWAQRDSATRTVLIPGPDQPFEESWASADWVLPGTWLDTLAALGAPPWRPQQP